jgi:peptide/nickel transport system substrate-binding protein
LLTLALASALTLAACGSDDGDGSTSEGGALTIAQTSQPDYLDPALSYTVNGWEPMWVVYTPLLTYRHEEGDAGSEVIPGLAEDLPEVTDGGSTYKLTLRKGLKYSDGTPVVAGDFEHTIKRVLNLESGGAPYYEVIAGATEYIENGNAEADIPGIVTNDQTGDITIKLTEPNGSFLYSLTLLFSGLVPGDTPFRNMTTDPPPGVGPFKITKSEPNREFVLEKNENFEALGIPDIPAAKVDKITTVIMPNACQQAQDMINNELDYVQDPPCSDFKAEVIEKFGPDSQDQRYAEYPTLSTYYMFLNNTLPPFDDQKVREAVNIGLDKPALARIFAGELQTGCSFLPPGAIGYDEALDTTDCPFGDPNEPPDLERARQMIEDAGAAGAEVTVYGNTDDPTPAVTQAYADQLEQMGFNTTVKILNGGIYFQAIGNEETAAQTGFLNWFADFPHPSAFYFLVDGATIQPTNNQNISYVDDPKINREIARLNAETDTESVAEDWAALDRYLVEEAFQLPYGHRKLATFVSERIPFGECTRFHPLFQNDYTAFCVEE